MTYVFPVADASPRSIPHRVIPFVASIVFALGIGGTVSVASAAVVFLTGQDDPLYAVIVEERADQVVLDVDDGSGRLARRTFRLGEIAEIIRTVSEERLTALTPDDPAAYRTYAEELAEKRTDPEARQAAIRLFLLTARLAPADQGRASLLALTRLVSPEQAGQVRAVAFLLDPTHDRSVLTPPRPAAPASAAAPPASGASSAEAISRRAIEFIYRVRHQQSGPATTLWNDPAVRERVTSAAAEFPTEDVTAWLKRGGVVKTEVLLALVRAERALRGGGDTGRAGDADTTSGAADPLPAIVAGATAVPVLSLEAISPYDLSATVYRDGAWRRP